MTFQEEEAEAATCRLLYGFGVFHTVVSERRRHGHFAWAHPPAFTTADLILTINVITVSHLFLGQGFIIGSMQRFCPIFPTTDAGIEAK